MLKLAADENFNNGILRGVLRELPDLDFVRVQDVGLAAADDEDVLAWAASEGRVLFTHDVRTLRKLADDRVVRGEPMPGVIEVPLTLQIRQAIQDIVLIAACSESQEWEHQVRFLPLPRRPA